MGCGCNGKSGSGGVTLGSPSKMYRVIYPDRTSKDFATRELAQAEIRAKGGRIRPVTVATSQAASVTPKVT